MEEIFDCKNGYKTKTEVFDRFGKNDNELELCMKCPHMHVESPCLCVCDLIDGGTEV